MFDLIIGTDEILRFREKHDCVADQRLTLPMMAFAKETMGEVCCPFIEYLFLMCRFKA